MADIYSEKSKLLSVTYGSDAREPILSAFNKINAEVEAVNLLSDNLTEKVSNASNTLSNIENSLSASTNENESLGDVIRNQVPKPISIQHGFVDIDRSASNLEGLNVVKINVLFDTPFNAVPSAVLVNADNSNTVPEQYYKTYGTTKYYGIKNYKDEYFYGSNAGIVDLFGKVSIEAYNITTSGFTIVVYTPHSSPLMFEGRSEPLLPKVIYWVAIA